MNRIAEEILSYYGISELSENDILRHYGMPRRSGRYPWGSGENPYQHSADFLARVEELQKQGKSEKEIADEIGLTTTELRVQKSLAKDERRGLEVATAKALKEKPEGYVEPEKRERPRREDRDGAKLDRGPRPERRGPRPERH